MRKYSVVGIRSSVYALLITGYWILNTLALPSPSLAANDCPTDPTDNSMGCMLVSKCIDPKTGSPFPTKPSAQCNKIPPASVGDWFICCVTGSGPKPCEADNSCVSITDKKYCVLGICIQQSRSDALCDPIGGTAGTGVQTAIGCLAAGDPKLFISQLLGWGVGVGGGIAFLMIVFAGFQIATAAGDPKRVQAAKELLTSAISGLILIVLSVLLLNFIGVKILHLPGFAL